MTQDSINFMSSVLEAVIPVYKMLMLSKTQDAFPTQFSEYIQIMFYYYSKMLNEDFEVSHNTTKPLTSCY